MTGIREGYKQTETGIIPEDWEVKGFYDCVTIKNGQVDPKIEPYCDMIHIGPANMEKFTGRLLYFNTAKEDGQTSGKYLFSKDDILYGKINPQFGKVVFPKFIGVCSADVYPLRANDKCLYCNYLFYLLQTNDFLTFAISVSMRTGMPKVNRDELSDYNFIIPPLAEQQKIADILSCVDDDISEVDSLIEKTKELKKGLMQQLLTKGIGHTKFKQTELGEIPESWEVKKLGEVATTTSGGTPNRARKDFYINGTIFWIKSGELNNKYIYYSSEKITDVAVKNSSVKMFLPNTIILAMYGATVGKVSILKTNATTNQACCGIFCKDEYSLYEYVYYIINYDKESLIEKAAGAAQPNINQQIIKDHLIRIPPIAEQQKIADILSSVDTQIEEYQVKKEKLTTIKKGLMEKLLTGEMRVNK